MATRMQQRRGTASTWTSANPILAAGEIGFEIDTNKFKIGDGSNRWANLSYFSDNEALTDLIDGAPGLLDTLNELAAAIGDDANYASTITNALALKAPLASPDLTGIPTAPTAALGTNTTQVATTAFVDAAIEALASRSLVLDGGGV